MSGNKLEPAIGIDLGTTFSVIAHVDSYGQPRTILNSDGDATLPSAVLFDRNDVIVGKEALRAASLEPEQVARFAKRDMGRPRFRQTVAGRNDWSPEMIQSFILQRLKADAERVIGPFSRAVITVPAYFNDPRRRSTQEAAELAQIDVLDIINEPTAAAISYCSSRQGESANELVLVYDLGGGTFDVSLVQINGTHFQTLATDGDVNLGGIDWDRRIIDFVCDQYQKQNRGIDPRSDSSFLQKMLLLAEDAKRTLSQRSSANFFLDTPYQFRTTVTRETFEEVTTDLLDRTRWTSDKVREMAGKSWDDIHTVLTVGGASLMPMVGKMLRNLTGKEPSRLVSPHEAIAHGAALYAHTLLQREAGQPVPMLIDNVNAHSLGIQTTDRRTGQKKLAVLIPRNQRLPARGSQTFRTLGTGRTIKLEVFEGGDDYCQRGRIGRCRWPLPASVPVGTPVTVVFEYLANGRLQIFVEVPGMPPWQTELVREDS